MRHALELGMIALVLALFWAAGCVIAAAGLHLFRRIDVMLGYRYGWKDAGVQMRATRRRRDGREHPVSHRAPEPEQRHRIMGAAKQVLAAQGPMFIEDRPPLSEQTLRIPVTRGGHGEARTQVHHAGRPPWESAEQPAVAEDTMILSRPDDA
jgi:hypothetical protein